VRISFILSRDGTEFLNGNASLTQDRPEQASPDRLTRMPEAACRS
jgi:hypothetical protein